MTSRTPIAASQLRFALERATPFDEAGFILSPASAAAVTAIGDWHRWPNGRLVIVGPEGSGKSHLAAIWASRAAARIVTPGEPIGMSGALALVLEDADRRPTDEAMFHAVNAAEAGGVLLMTARAAPRTWLTDLPDLRSRLNASRVVEIAPPDDATLLGLLIKFFRERNIRPPDDVLAYLTRRIERSGPAARAVVARIDETAAAEGREITRTLAREVLDRLEGSGDLFDQGCGEPEGAAKGGG